MDHSARLELELEIAQTERALVEIRREIQIMIDDPDADLSRLMRKNAQRTEMEAYYKGLTFTARIMDASRRGAENSSH